MKRVLLLLPTYSSYFKPLYKTFKKLNWQVKFFDYRRGDMMIRFLRFIPLIGGRKKAQRQIDSEITKMARNFKPDLILTVKGELIGKDLINKIKTEKNIIANWFPDPINHWELMKKIAPHYDFFFHFDPLVVRKLKKLGYKNIWYLPFACEIQKNISGGKTLDISFVGTYSKFREEYLNHLSGSNLNIWGDARWYQSQLKKNTRGGRISQDEMKDIIKKTKVNINLHGFRPTQGTNLRTFEVTGCGGFLLSEYVKDLDRLFIINKEIVCFYSPHQMKRKLKMYLDNNELREKIAISGYEKAAQDHSYEKRIREMLRRIYA